MFIEMGIIAKPRSLEAEELFIVFNIRVEFSEPLLRHLKLVITYERTPLESSCKTKI